MYAVKSWSGFGEGGIEYRPQWTKMSSFASVYQRGTGRVSAMAFGQECHDCSSVR
jgi:hypothetical protein